MSTVRRFLAALSVLLFANAGMAGGGVTFSPTTLPEATVNASYSATVKVTVPSGAAILDIFCNSGLPSGVNFGCDSSKGEFYIYGTPKAVGSYSIDVGVLMLNSGSSSTASVVLPLTVKAGGAAAPSIKGASPVSPVTMSAGDKTSFYVTLDAAASVRCIWSKYSAAEGWKTLYNGTYSSISFSYQYEHDGASSQLRAQVYSSDGKTLYGTVSWVITSGGSGGGDKVEFSVKNPPTGTVNLTLGQEQYFEVEADGDTKDCSINWTLTKSASVYNLGSALGCSFKSSDYGEGTYQLKFSAEDKTGNKSEFFWTIVVTSSTPKPAGEVKAASPNLYYCSQPALSTGTLLELADKAAQTFSITVDANVSPLYYYWTVNGKAAAGASTSSSTYAYTHSASASQTQIYCQVYSDDKMENLLCYGVWVVKETAMPIDIVATPPVADGMVEVPYGPIQFASASGVGITWDAVSQLSLVREASTFASAAAETIAGGEGVTKLTLQGGETAVSLGFTYTMLGRPYTSASVSQYYGSIHLYNANQVSINGLYGEWAFQNEGDGVYVSKFADHVTFRWQGQRVTYVMSGGGGGGGGGGTGSTPVYHNAAMAITIYDSGEVRISFGSCEAALELSGPRFYATGANAATLDLPYENPGSEMASNAQDVFFKSTLPPGLVFDATPSSAKYGQLYGTPTRAGTYTFTISGMNGSNPASKEYTVTISENNIPKPTFKDFSPKNGIGNPATVEVQVGSSQTLTVETENTTTIDWYVGNVKAATGATFEFTATQAMFGVNPPITCKLSNEYYADYATLTWYTNIMSLPFNLDLEDGATIPQYATQFEPFDYTLGATGGATTAYVWTIVEGELPNGLTLAADGKLSGVPTGDSGTYQIKVSATSGPQTKTATYSLVVEVGTNVAPVFVSSTPAADSVIAYVGVAKEFSVVCGDADGDQITYIWKTFHGTSTNTLSETGASLSYTPTWTIDDVTMSCSASDGRHEPVLVREWSVNVKEAPLAFETSTDLEVATGAWIGGDSAGAALSLNDHDTEIASVDVSGTLPQGVVILHSAKRYVYVTGAVRTHGSYSFSLTVTLADGETATMPVNLTVTGADMGTAKWYIDPVNGNDGNTGLSAGSALSSVYLIGARLLAGDTVVLMPGDYIYTFHLVEGVSYEAVDGLLRFPAGCDDISSITLKNGAGIAFVVGGGDWFYDEAINVVAVPVGAKVSDYTVRTTTADYVLHGSPYIEDGWLKAKPLWHYDSHGRIIMRFAENGNKEYTFNSYVIQHAAMFYNEGGENATVHFAGNSQCSLTFCTFLWATNGVDLVLDENATLWCHQEEKIEGFDTMTFSRSSTLRLDNQPGDITVRGGVQPVFAGTKGSYTLKLNNPMEWGARRAIVWDYEGQPLDEFDLVVASGENRADYEFQNFGNHLYVVKRYQNGDFPNLEQLCPAAQISSQSPAAYAASSKNPLGLTVGTPATFMVESMYPQVKGFTWMCGVRFELDGVPVPGDFYSGCTITPTNDMVDNVDRDKRHHLRATLVDYYHDPADTADWYFTVSPTPPTVAALPRISAWDGDEFSRDFAEYVTGGYGALHFMRESGSLSDGISLTANGVLTGTMTAALDDEDLAISVMDEWGSVATFTQKLHLKTSENEPPYVVSVNPAADELDYYIGDWIHFTAITEDDDTNYYYYQWVLDGETVKYGHLSEFDTKTPYYDFDDSDPAHETDVSTLLLQLRDDSTGDWITAKGWTINKLERPTQAEGGDLGEIPVGTKYLYTQNEHISLECETEVGAHIVSAEVIRGELPDGMELADSQHGAFIIGEARKLGTSMFSIEYTSSNGQKAFATYELTIVGEADTEPRTWTVCSWNWWNAHGTEYPGTTYRVTFDYDGGSDGLLGLAAGDTVNIYGDSNLDPLADAKNRLAKDGVTFNFVRGPIRLERHPNQPLYLMAAVFSNEVTSLDFTLPTDDLPFGETYGEVVQIAEMPTVLYNRLHPTVTSDYFFEGAPYLDEHRVFSVKILGYSPLENYDLIDFADDITRRDAIFKDKNRGSHHLDVANAGVLPSSLTFKGDVRLSAVGLDYHNSAKYPNHNTKVILDKTLDMHLGTATPPAIQTAYGAVEIERGARIHVSQGVLTCYSSPLIETENSVTLAGDENEKVTIVLPDALPDHSRLMVCSRYFDDSDPTESFQVELPSWVENKDAYHFVITDGYMEGRYVYLQNYEDEAAEEHGETAWNESSDLGTVELGNKLEHVFTPSTFKAAGYTTSFTSVGKPYEISRGDGCSFDGNIGTAELEYAPFITEGSTGTKDIVDLGFAFPIEDTYCLWVHVLPNGQINFSANSQTKTLVVLESDPSVQPLLSKLTESYNHVYIARGEGTFTVRWGQFAMVTLHQDGRIVVAYGPLADDGRKAGDALCPTRYYHSSGGNQQDPRSVEFSLRSGMYAGKDDLILTPTKYVTTVTMSSTNGKVTHTAKRPGQYGVRLRYVADNSTTDDHCTWTRDFFWEVTGDEPRLPAITNFTARISAEDEDLEPEDDGIIHVYEGQGMPTFTVRTAELCKSLSIHCSGTLGNSGSDRSAISLTPDSNDISRINSYGEGGGWNSGVYSVVAKATVNDISAYRQLLFVKNKTFHIDCTTTTDAVHQDGSADKPWQDFPYVIKSGSYGKNSAPKFVRGDKLVYHPGTYHNPIWLDNCVGGIEITCAEGHSAADTEIIPQIYSKDGFGNLYGRRAFSEWTYSIEELTNGWKHVHKPTQKTIVTGLAFRNAAIGGDASIAADTASALAIDRGLSLYGIAGGGAFGGVFVNCVFEDCTATNGFGVYERTIGYDFPSYGGAVYGATLVNCLLVGNHADIGGAASHCTLFNCTVADNTADVSAGGIDGQCHAYNSLIRYNTCNDEVSEYANTYRISRLVPDVPELHDCFTAGDPMLCADYTLFPGSPCIGAGNAANYLHYSDVDLLGNPRFTDENTISVGAFEGEGSSKVTLKVETVGIGTVDPPSCPVTVGGSQTFTADSDRGVAGWYTNGVLAASSGDEFTWVDIPALCNLKVVFGSKTITVGELPGHDYETIDEAIENAGSGDLIVVAAGTYGPINLADFPGALEIRAESYTTIKDDATTWGAAGDVIIDGGGTERCITARVDDDSLLFRGLLLTNGCINASIEYEAGGGGGIRGGKAERCTVVDCRAYLCGGGAYNATLERCLVTGNVAFKNTNKEKSCGGGAYGGTLYDCRVTGNRIDSWFLNGGGTYDAIVKNSFVWGNYAGSNMASNAEAGECGAEIYVVEKVPTEQRVAAQPAQLQAPGEEMPVVYANRHDAEVAAASTGIDVANEVVVSGIDIQDYIGRFEVTTAWSTERNGWENTVDLKPAEVDKVIDQIADVLVVDDDGNDVAVFNVQRMERTLTETTPGLYYALEFSADLTNGSFFGERHLATGSGSVKLSATSLDTPSGFWRIKVYLTRDGE